MKALVLINYLAIISLKILNCQSLTLNRSILEQWLGDGIMGIYIDISDKNVTTIEKNTFTDLRNLTELIISNNLIVSIEMGMFDGPVNLISLEID